MSDGRIDGHFILNTNMAASIRDELGLSVVECKQMGCVWEQVLDEVNNSANYETENNNQQNVNFQAGTVIKLTKECWTRIVNLVNNALKSFSDRQIQSEDSSEYYDNINLGEAAIQRFNETNPNAESSTYYKDLREYLIRYGNDNKKLDELKSNPLFVELAEYIENYQAGKISLDELERRATELDEGNGNNIRCGERAQIIQNNLEKQGIKSEVICLAEIDNIEFREDEEGKYPYMARPEHAFCIVGLDENADTTDPSSLGKNAIIIDAWLGKTFSVEEGIKYYKEFFRYNDSIDESGAPKEYKMSFGTQEEIWERLPDIE